VKDPLIDQFIADRFEVRSRIGEGGMSVVYLAKDHTAGGEAAIKVLHPNLGDSEDFVARFHQEAKTAGKLQHPNAVNIIDSGVQNGMPYIAMEYCPGRSLKRIIREEAPLSVGRAADLASQILSALDAAHEMGIIHRDLKPENVRVAVRGGREFVKILDFGVAKFVGTDSVKEMTGAVKTRTGIVFGTPKYMAPEQIMGEKIDSRIDVYAAGVILYEMIAGVPPFESEDLYGYVTKHLHEPAPPIREKVPEVDAPESIERLILRTLSKDKESRPKDAGALAQELAPFVVSGKVSRLSQYGGGAAGFLVGGVCGAAAAYEIARVGPGLELGLASAALGIFGGLGFLLFGRTATRNLLLRLLLVLVGVTGAQGALWAVRGGDGVANAAAVLTATFVFVLFCTARGFRGRLWRAPLCLLAGVAAGAFIPVLEGGVYVRLWQVDAFAGDRPAALMAATAIGVAIGIGGLLVPREAPAGVSRRRSAE
jgi:predicted Ser/Thr protein kinase